MESMSSNSSSNGSFALLTFSISSPFPNSYTAIASNGIGNATTN